MGRVDQCAELVQEGRTPDEIAARLRLNVTTVVGYIDRGIGQQLIQRSDVLLNIREALEYELAEGRPLGMDASLDEILSASPQPIDHPRNDLEFLLKHGYSHTLSSDLLQKLALIEQDLHSAIANTLISHHGSAKERWWESGVPNSVRKTCEHWRSFDDEPSHPYTYTSLGHLAKIVEGAWPLFQSKVPSLYSQDRKGLSGVLHQLRQIRNLLAHPVRNHIPDRDMYDQVKKAELTLRARNWN